MKIQDTRPKNTRRETIAVAARDEFMSGWGEAEGGYSYAAWACKSHDDAEKVSKWLNGREEMQDIQIIEAATSRDLKMCIITAVSGFEVETKHLSIYNVNKGHRALKGGAK